MRDAEHRSQGPAPLLIAQAAKFPKGLLLDIACGFGRNGLYLAAQGGHRVIGFDQTEAAVAFCNQAAKDRNLPFSARCMDLEKDFPAETGAAGVCCFYYLDRAILPKIKRALKIAGVVIYETFLIDQHRHYGKPARQSFCWQHNELLRAFSEFRIHYYYEGMIFPEAGTDTNEGRWVAQLVAERTA